MNIAGDVKKKATLAVKVVGIGAIVLGAIPLFDMFLVTVFVVYPALTVSRPPAELIFLLASTAIAWALPLAKVITGYGLVSARDWARTAAIAVFTIDFVLRLSDAVAFCIQCYFYRNIPLFVKASEWASATMWPSYILALINLLFVAVLNRDTVKRLFQRGKEGEGSSSSPAPRR